MMTRVTGVVLLSLLTTASGFCPPQKHAAAPHPMPMRNAAAMAHQSLPTSLLASDAGGMDPLLVYLAESIISNGVPAFFTILVLGFAASQFRSSRDRRDLSKAQNPVARLYDDLYGDQEQPMGLGKLFGGNSKDVTLPQNLGVPREQFFQLTHLNRKYESYQYSFTAATTSKAQAAATLRQSSLQRALGKALGPSLAPSVLARLATAEQRFLKEGALTLQEVQNLQTQLTQSTVDDELKAMGLENVYALSATNKTQTTKSKSRNDQLQSLAKAQRELQMLELDFIKEVITVVGPEQAAAVRTALLGSGGSILQALQDRPLSSLLRSDESTKRVFVTRFPGDATASQVATLREEVTAIVRNANPGDEVLLVLQTGGGTVTGYGLAAAQLLRIKNSGLKLTIAVEQVAASGGYMMCCIADRIVASPFAVLGSIGVISDIPNVYDRLKQEGIEFQTVTAGKYKRTLTPTKKVTKEDFAKTKSDIEGILVLFKGFVAENRPQLDIDEVATGETWFGTDALDRKLCDEIKTADEVIADFVDSGYDAYEIKYTPPPTQRIASLLTASSEDTEVNTFVGRALRWLGAVVAREVEAQLESMRSPSVESQYKVYDDSQEKYRMR